MRIVDHQHIAIAFIIISSPILGIHNGMAETPSDESRGVLVEISTLPKILEGSAAVGPSRQDCGPTRSNSRNTEAAQETLRTRMFSGLFQDGRQARLHALPVNAQLAPGREGESDGIEHAGQPGAIEIPLDQLLATEPTVGTTVEPLPEWLTRVGATRMTILRQLGLKGGNLMQLGGASSCNHALDGVYKAPRGTQPHASAKAALPAFVADFLDPQIIAHADDLVGHVAMQPAPV